MKPGSGRLVWFSLWLSVSLALVVVTHSRANQTVTFDFSGGAPGSPCASVMVGAYISSVTGSSGPTIVAAADAGGAAPECSGPIGFIIRLTAPADAVAFLAFKRTGSIGVDLYLGGTLVGSDVIPGGAPAAYSRALRFDEIRLRELFSLSPIRMDNFTLTYFSRVPVAPQDAPQDEDRGFDPGDDRVAPSVSARVNAYCHDYGLTVYLGGAAFLVEPALFDPAVLPAQNTLLLERHSLRVYRLTDGLLQIMTATGADGKQEFLLLELETPCGVVRWRRGEFDTLTVRSRIYAESAARHWAGYPYEY